MASKYYYSSSRYRCFLEPFQLVGMWKSTANMSSTLDTRGWLMLLILQSYQVVLQANPCRRRRFINNCAAQGPRYQRTYDTRANLQP